MSPGCDGPWAQTVCLFCDVGEPAAREDAGAPAPRTWGEYTARLDLPDCPASPNPELIVDTTASDLDGGETLNDPDQAGPTLSLVEAFWIAANRAGPDIIRFDAAAFPPDRPATILIRGTGTFPFSMEPLCLDGRGRGVIVDWAEEAQGYPTSIWQLREGSLMVGLTLLRLPFEIEVIDAQIAGCRVATDGHTRMPTDRFWSIDVVRGSIIGPHNVLSGYRALRLWNASDTLTQIVDNDFALDPLSGAHIAPGYAIDGRRPAFLVRNRLAATEILISRNDPVNTDQEFQISNNMIGTDAEGEPLPVGSPGIVVGWPGKTFISGNVMKYLATAVTVGHGTQVRVSQNVITANGEGIAFLGEAPVAPPTITGVSSTEVIGTCPTPGFVEVFSDPFTQGAQFVGLTTCDDWEPWRALLLDPPAHRNLTATLTDVGLRTSTFSATFPAPQP